jgi:hypothetical protein
MEIMKIMNLPRTHPHPAITFHLDKSRHSTIALIFRYHKMYSNYQVKDC